MFRVLVTGSREWNNKTKIIAEFRPIYRAYGKSVTVIVGGARGADKIAEELAVEAGWQVELHKPNWYPESPEVMDKTAGFKRNQEMVDSGADICLAFIAYDAEGNPSRGANHCATQARHAGIPTLVTALVDKPLWFE